MNVQTNSFGAPRFLSLQGMNLHGTILNDVFTMLFFQGVLSPGPNDVFLSFVSGCKNAISHNDDENLKPARNDQNTMFQKRPKHHVWSWGPLCRPAKSLVSSESFPDSSEHFV